MTATQGIWPAVLGRFDWHALPFVRAYENPTASEIIGAFAASLVIVGAVCDRRAAHPLQALAADVVRMADQPGPQEDRDHVHRDRLRHAVAP